MNQQGYDTAVAAFIRAKWVTRCPTVCISPTQAVVSEADCMALRLLDEDRETRRTDKKLRKIPAYRFGEAA